MKLAFARSLYRMVPFKRNIFLLVRRYLKLPRGVYQHLSFTGPFTVSLPQGRSFKIRSHASYVENDLFWSGFGSKFEGQSQLVYAALSESCEGTILDVGANTGVYSLTAKAVRPSARVIAFEPIARIGAKLKSNIALNRFDIRVAEVAASDHSGTAMINDPGGEHNYSSSLESFLKLDGESYQIKTVELDRYVASEALHPVRLMKIDVEAHEPAVLRGMGRILREDRPAMLIEVLAEELGQEIEYLLAGLGYSFYKIDEAKGLIPASHLGPLGGEDRNNLICTPEQFEQAKLRRFLVKI